MSGGSVRTCQTIRRSYESTKRVRAAHEGKVERKRERKEVCSELSAKGGESHITITRVSPFSVSRPIRRTSHLDPPRWS